MQSLVTPYGTSGSNHHPRLRPVPGWLVAGSSALSQPQPSDHLHSQDKQDADVCLLPQATVLRVADTAKMARQAGARPIRVCPPFSTPPGSRSSPTRAVVVVYETHHHHASACAENASCPIDVLQLLSLLLNGTCNFPHLHPALRGWVYPTIHGNAHVISITPRRS
jgi:hypothetical protein